MNDTPTVVFVGTMGGEIVVRKMRVRVDAGDWLHRVFVPGEPVNEFHPFAPFTMSSTITARALKEPISLNLQMREVTVVAPNERCARLMTAYLLHREAYENAVRADVCLNLAMHATGVTPAPVSRPTIDPHWIRTAAEMLTLRVFDSIRVGYLPHQVTIESGSDGFLYQWLGVEEVCTCRNVDDLVSDIVAHDVDYCTRA